MTGHVCPWWGGCFLDNRFRRILHSPERILVPYLQPGMTVLDFGCGMGLFALAMAQMVGDRGCVIAVDLQEKMLDVVERRAKRAGLTGHVRTHRCQRDALGINDQVDFALAFWSIHEVPDSRKLLAEVHDCLVPGGRFLVAEPRIHVSARAFGRMLDTAREIGFSVNEAPRIWFSRAVALVKA